jgi:hypothetical protein
LSSQGFSMEERMWVYILLGRGLFWNEDFDKWKFAVLFIGSVGEILLNLFSSIYQPDQIEFLDSKSNAKLQNLYEKFVVLGSAEKIISTDQEQFQKCINNLEEYIIPGERKDGINSKKLSSYCWKTPIFMTSQNMILNCKEYSLGLRRNLVILKMNNARILDLGTNLRAKLKSELGRLVPKIARAYKWAVEIYGGNDDDYDISSILPDSFRDASEEMIKANNPLYSFIKSKDFIILSPSSSMQFEEFQSMFKMFCRKNGYSKFQRERLDYCYCEFLFSFFGIALDKKTMKLNGIGENCNRSNSV